jgi:Flp pilus assembly protein TadD
LEGQFSEAKKEMNQTLSLNPDNIEALMFLAEIYLKFGEEEKCDSYLNRVALLKNKLIPGSKLSIAVLKKQIQK